MPGATSRALAVRDWWELNRLSWLELVTGKKANDSNSLHKEAEKCRSKISRVRGAHMTMTEGVVGIKHQELKLEDTSRFTTPNVGSHFRQVSDSMLLSLNFTR